MEIFGIHPSEVENKRFCSMEMTGILSSGMLAVNEEMLNLEFTGIQCGARLPMEKFIGNHLS